MAPVLGVRLTWPGQRAIARAASRLRSGGYSLGVRLTWPEQQAITRAASRLRSGSYSRRGFLGAAGALVGVLWAGCGRDEARMEPPSDAEVLRGLLRREAAAAGAASGVVARQDAEHLDELAARAGVAPPEPPGGGDAVSLKQLAVFGYVDALPKLSDPELRVLVMQIAASEAEHIAALRLEAGEEPVPDAFAGFTVEGA
jgi:hypothetical protein